MATGHGITTGALVDVYWEGGVRYGVTVGTVNGQAVPLTDSGAGDVLPADETPIVIGLVTVIDTDFDGDKAAMLAALTTNADTLTSAPPPPAPTRPSFRPMRLTSGPATPG